MPKKKPTFPTTYIIIATILVVIMTSSYIFKFGSNNPTIEVVSTPTVDTTHTTKVIETITQPDVPAPSYPVGWQVYVNEDQGFSFAYPETVAFRGASYDGYVDYRAGKAYFVAQGIDSLGGVEVRQMTTEEVLKDLFKYRNNIIAEKTTQTKEKVTFNGYSSVKYTLQTVTEQGDEIGFIYILIEDQGKTYILTWGYGYDNEITYEQLGEKILKTFRIIK